MANPQPATTTRSQADAQCYHAYVSLLSDDEQCEIQSAIEESLQARKAQNATVDLPDVNVKIADVLNDLRASIDFDSSPARFNIARSHLWEGIKRAVLRPSFSPTLQISVKFMDDLGNAEGAVDQGGPKRELLQLAMQYLGRSSCLFIGEDGCKHLNAIQLPGIQQDFFVAGMLIALSFIHEGPAPHLLSESLFAALCDDPSTVHVPVTALPPSSMKDDLIAISAADNVEEVNRLMDAADWLAIVGVCQHVGNLEQRNEVLALAANWLCFGRTRSALERFKDGLKSLNILSTIRKYPNLFKPLMCGVAPRDNVVSVENLFQPKLSDNGTSRRELENVVYMYFLNFLEDIDDDKVDFTFTELLQFATGVAHKPPAGFGSKPSIEFLHDCDPPALFPKANTCSCTLHLPVVHKSYEEFVHYITFGIKNAHGFGYA